MTSPYTDLATSQALDALAKAHTEPCPEKIGNEGLNQHLTICRCNGLGIVYSYRNGLGDWLREQRGSEWPSMVWSRRFGEYIPEFWYEPKVLITETEEVRAWHVHALTWQEALDFFEQVRGWRWQRKPSVIGRFDYDAYHRDHANRQDASVRGVNPAALVAAIRAEEEKAHASTS